MIEQDEFLLQIVARLQAAGIAYMLAGSYASNIHGQPRATADVDVVIDADREKLKQFLSLLQEHEYASESAAMEALEHRSMFNVIDTLSGWKVDLIVRKDRAFSIEEFRRRQLSQFHEHEVFVVSPEDAILSKLEWGKKCGSDRQLQDAETIVVWKRDELDFDYLRRWAAELQVEDELQRVLQQAEQSREENGIHE